MRSIIHLINYKGRRQGVNFHPVGVRQIDADTMS